MNSDTQQLEGLGKLLKAAGVKPAGAEAMVRDHLNEIQDDARQYHAELIASVKTLEKELVELRYNHTASVSEIRMATDLMRREIEARSVSAVHLLQFAEFVLLLLVALQVVVIVVLQTTVGENMPDIGDFIPVLERAHEGPNHELIRPQAAPPTFSRQLQHLK